MGDIDEETDNEIPLKQKKEGGQRVKHLFLYNWQIRDEWMNLFQQLPHEELIRERVGGVGSILRTFFHIVDVEYSWTQVLMGEDISDPCYEEYMSLDLIMKLSNDCREHIKEFINSISTARDYEIVTPPWSRDQYYFGEVLRHVIAHEIHHVGQFSVWAKQIGLEVVSSNFIDRGLINKKLD
ncbi:DinB family protein [compost metagenome]